MDLNIEHKQNDRRGVFLIEGDSGIISELTYSIKNENTIIIDHTETKIPEEGKGFAGKLVAHAVDYAREHNLKIDPLCPFAEVQFERHPEYNDVRA